MNAVLLALLLTLSQGLADEPDFQRATALYTELECEQALTAFQRLEARSAWSGHERAQLSVWQALCFAQLAQSEARDAALARALRDDRDVQLPEFAPPAIRSALEDQRTLLPPAVAPREDAAAARERPAREPSAALDEERPRVAAVESPLASPPDAVQTTDLPQPMPARGDAILALSQGTLIVGGVAALGALVMASFALPHVQAAANPDAFQSDAIRSANEANAYLSWAGGLLAGGGALAVSGAVVTLLGPGPTEAAPAP